MKDYKLNIKFISLEYIRKYLTYMHAEDEILNKINLFHIFMLFFKFTLNQKLIDEVCNTLEFARQCFPYKCFKSDIHSQIEDYVIK